MPRSRPEYVCQNCGMNYNNPSDLDKCKEDKQKLVDLMFNMVLVVADDHNFGSSKEAAEWVSKQLLENGFDTEPVGTSWGKLKDGR